MKIIALAVVAIMCSIHVCRSQSTFDVTISIDPTSDTTKVSPYIFGSNGQSDDHAEKITARRMGGNRMTGYNWENNASNAGLDFEHQSDNYLTWIAGIPPSLERVPGIAVTAFHDSSVASKCYSLITLQAAGYVAHDKDGPVLSFQAAPSARWDEVQFAKGSAFALKPDTTDGFVYMDEFVNALVNKYGLSNTTNGIRGYAIDNEPALWPSTHPRIHPLKPTCREVFDKTAQLSLAVKRVDPTAEIFGGVMYGFAEYENNQNAEDWVTYSIYGTYIDAFLTELKNRSTAAGKRLLDVLDLHWYPEAQGPNVNGSMIRIANNEVADSGVAYARMQAPRTLWDSSYTESSWIAQFFSPVALLPRLSAAIKKNYPGTKLAFTEFNYGGSLHISGGIAVADVLGLFMKHNVYMSNYWGPIEGYVSSAYHIYNPHTRDSAATRTNMRVTSTNYVDCSAYGYSTVHDNPRFHVVLINKDFNRTMNAHVVFTKKMQPPFENMQRGEAWSFTAGDSNVTFRDTLSGIANDTLTYSVPPLTVVRLDLNNPRGVGVAVAGATMDRSRLRVEPNPSNGAASIHFTMAEAGSASLILFDAVGRVVWTMSQRLFASGDHHMPIGMDGSPSILQHGVYWLQLHTADGVATHPITIVK